MNKATRKQAQDIHDVLTNAMSELDMLRDAEQEKFDNMPESLQSGSAGEKMQEGVDYLGEAYDAVEQALQALDSIVTP